MTTDITTETFAIPQLPEHWVVRYQGALYIVPAIANGWRKKSPYRGHDPAKMATAQKVNAITLLSVGIPDQPGDTVEAADRVIFGR